jgi:hypothetical protein
VWNRTSFKWKLINSNKIKTRNTRPTFKIIMNTSGPIGTKMLGYGAF